MHGRRMNSRIPELPVDARFESDGSLIDWSRGWPGHIWYNHPDVSADLH